MDLLQTHPLEILSNLATEWQMDLYSEEFSKELDNQNIWPSNRHRFYYPKLKDLPNSTDIYFEKIFYKSNI